METAAVEKLVGIKKKKLGNQLQSSTMSAPGEVKCELPSHTFLAAEKQYEEWNCVEVFHICTGNYF